jgi:heme oxygenase
MRRDVASLVMTRLEHATSERHALADGDRLALLTGELTPGRYCAFLLRVFGFEVQVDSALHLTRGLADIIDLRSRLDLRRLKADLGAIDVPNLATVPRARDVVPFQDPLEALGWLYVVERNVRLHCVLRRHLLGALPELAIAGSYLATSERAVAARMRELGDFLDVVGRTPERVDRMIVAAHAAFRAQHDWFSEPSPRLIRVA